MGVQEGAGEDLIRVLAPCERNWALNLATNVFKSCKVMVAAVQLIHMRYP